MTKDDLISRQAAIDALDGEIEITGRTNAEAVKGYVRLVKDRLERLPSATPRQKIGRWEHGKEISREYRGQALVSIDYLDWHCSNCHCVVEQSIKPKWDYCPSCGAKMQESEDKE